MPRGKQGGAGNGPRGRRAGRKSGSEKLIEGIIDVTRSGKGFVEDIRGGNDIQIFPEGLNTALNGDRVSVRLTRYDSRNRRPIGEVAQVLERAKTRFVGVVAKENLPVAVPARGMPKTDKSVRPTPEAFRLMFRADDRRMYSPILLKKDTQVDEGAKVVVELVRWENPHLMPEGRLVETIGKAGEHETEMRAALAARGFDYSFPEPIVREAEHITENRDRLLQEGAADKTRRDMRAVPTFTIDPADAKDFDDALSYRMLPTGEAEIGIHIADVTHFVQSKTPIDKEGAKRGTSVYLVDRTIPMLPPILSEDLCSLKPNEERLAFSAIFTLREDGTVTSRWFGRTVIFSRKRFTYEEAQAILDAALAASSRPTGRAEHVPFREELVVLNALAKKIYKKRVEAGAISFDQDEVKFVLDEAMRPVQVLRKKKHETNALIEEFMLLANREVAQFVGSKMKGNRDGLFVYRIHDVPNNEKIEELAVFLRAIGYVLNAEKGKLSVRDLNRLFDEIKGKPEEHLIKTATIRSMAKAVYSTKNIGHFGLAFEHYTHFTSPIRRYPDMMVHRILEKALAGKPLTAEERDRYEELAIKCSEREIAAVEAERESIKFKQVEYMSERVGQTFQGVISGVTEWGIYVEEKETKSEGMVRLTSLTDDTYMLDRQNFRVVGLNRKKQYSLGDSVNVKLLKADLEERTLDFELIT